ncbi:hypothetical protein PENSUB_10781 [Penicillium subrubescens]|uniref:Uncharacterized protein n=1 Tax=Penicillium subrubescens TaxID=1316194 RepID=A0A1Q5T8R3_9EURO|nr:hypothetical protein PENSUB_10781 [Penicillium subrubescens]
MSEGPEYSWDPLDEDTGYQVENGVLHVGPGRTGRVLRDAEIQGLGAAPPEFG